MAVMNYVEFNALINKAARRMNREEGITYPVYLVNFRYKYTHDAKWEYTTELFMWYWKDDTYYWENDWWEGQQEIEPYGMIPLDNVEIPCNLNPLPSL